MRPSPTTDAPNDAQTKAANPPVPALMLNDELSLSEAAPTSVPFAATVQSVHANPAGTPQELRAFLYALGSASASALATTGPFIPPKAKSAVNVEVAPFVERRHKKRPPSLFAAPQQQPSLRVLMPMPPPQAQALPLTVTNATVTTPTPAATAVAGGLPAGRTDRSSFDGHGRSFHCETTSGSRSLMNGKGTSSNGADSGLTDSRGIAGTASVIAGSNPMTDNPPTTTPTDTTTTSTTASTAMATTTTTHTRVDTAVLAHFSSMGDEASSHSKPTSSLCARPCSGGACTIGSPLSNTGAGLDAAAVGTGVSKAADGVDSSSLCGTSDANAVSSTNEAAKGAAEYAAVVTAPSTQTNTATTTALPPASPRRKMDSPVSRFASSSMCNVSWAAGGGAMHFGSGASPASSQPTAGVAWAATDSTTSTGAGLLAGCAGTGGSYGNGAVPLPSTKLLVKQQFSAPQMEGGEGYTATAALAAIFTGGSSSPSSQAPDGGVTSPPECAAATSPLPPALTSWPAGIISTGASSLSPLNVSLAPAPPPQRRRRVAPPFSMNPVAPAASASATNAAMHSNSANHAQNSNANSAGSGAGAAVVGPLHALVPQSSGRGSDDAARHDGHHHHHHHHHHHRHRHRHSSSSGGGSNHIEQQQQQQHIHHSRNHNDHKSGRWRRKKRRAVDVRLSRDNVTLVASVFRVSREGCLTVRNMLLLNTKRVDDTDDGEDPLRGVKGGEGGTGGGVHFESGSGVGTGTDMISPPTPTHFMDSTTGSPVPRVVGGSHPITGDVAPLLRPRGFVTPLRGQVSHTFLSAPNTATALQCSSMGQLDGASGMGGGALGNGSGMLHQHAPAPPHLLAAHSVSAYGNTSFTLQSSSMNTPYSPITYSMDGTTFPVLGGPVGSMGGMDHGGGSGATIPCRSRGPLLRAAREEPDHSACTSNDPRNSPTANATLGATSAGRTVAAEAAEAAEAGIPSNPQAAAAADSHRMSVMDPSHNPNESSGTNHRRYHPNYSASGSFFHASAVASPLLTPSANHPPSRSTVAERRQPIVCNRPNKQQLQQPSSSVHAMLDSSHARPMSRHTQSQRTLAESATSDNYAVDASAVAAAATATGTTAAGPALHYSHGGQEGGLQGRQNLLRHSGSATSLFAVSGSGQYGNAAGPVGDGGGPSRSLLLPYRDLPLKHRTTTLPPGLTGGAGSLTSPCSNMGAMTDLWDLPMATSSTNSNAHARTITTSVAATGYMGSCALASPRAPSNVVRYADLDIKVAIGEGASASVFVAIHQPTGRRLAVKRVDLSPLHLAPRRVLRCGSGRVSSSSHSRFLHFSTGNGKARQLQHIVIRELQVLHLTYRSPFMVKVYNAFFRPESDVLDIVMEFMHYGSLDGLGKRLEAHAKERLERHHSTHRRMTTGGGIGASSSTISTTDLPAGTPTSAGAVALPTPQPPRSAKGSPTSMLAPRRMSGLLGKTFPSPTSNGTTNTTATATTGGAGGASAKELPVAVAHTWMPSAPGAPLLTAGGGGGGGAGSSAPGSSLQSPALTANGADFPYYFNLNAGVSGGGNGSHHPNGGGGDGSANSTLRNASGRSALGADEDGGSQFSGENGEPIEELVGVAERVVAVVGEQLLRGVRDMHQRGYIHRDIKPGNVLVNEHGVVKLSDFGLSQRCDRKGVGIRNPPLDVTAATSVAPTRSATPLSSPLPNGGPLPAASAHPMMGSHIAALALPASAGAATAASVVAGVAERRQGHSAPLSPGAPLAENCGGGGSVRPLSVLTSSTSDFLSPISTHSGPQMAAAAPMRTRGALREAPPAAASTVDEDGLDVLEATSTSSSSASTPSTTTGESPVEPTQQRRGQQARAPLCPLSRNSAGSSMSSSSSPSSCSSSKSLSSASSSTPSSTSSEDDIRCSGTDKYMSPERQRGEQHGKPSDVWAVGVTLAEFALGFYPYDLEGCSDDFERAARMAQPVEILQLQRVHDPLRLDPSTGGDADDKSQSGRVGSSYGYGPHSRRLCPLTDVFADFIRLATLPAASQRPTAQELLEHPFFKQWSNPFNLKDYLSARVPVPSNTYKEEYYKRKRERAQLAGIEAPQPTHYAASMPAN